MLALKNTGKYYQFVLGLEQLAGNCCLLGAAISWWQGRSLTTHLVLWFLPPFILCSSRSRLWPQTGACGTELSGLLSVCWSMLIKKATSTTTTKEEGLFSCPLCNGDLKSGGRSWCLEESARRKGCDCLCRVIVVMAGQGIAVVEWKSPAASPCGSLCGCSRSWSIPMSRWSHDWERVSDGFVSSVGSSRPQGARKSCSSRKASPSTALWKVAGEEGYKVGADLNQIQSHGTEEGRR